MLLANGDWFDDGLGDVGEVGELPGAALGAWKVGIMFVRVYVATWKTEYTVNGKRARGI